MKIYLFMYVLMSILWANAEEIQFPLQLKEPFAEPFSIQEGAEAPKHYGNEFVYSNDNLIEHEIFDGQDKSHFVRMGNIDVFDTNSTSISLGNDIFHHTNQETITFGNKIIHKSDKGLILEPVIQ